MAKKKLGTDKNLVKKLENDDANPVMVFLKNNAPQLGAAIAGLIVAEIAQATVEHLLQKTVMKDANDSNSQDYAEADDLAPREKLQTVAANAISDLQSKIEDVKEPVKTSAQSVKAAAGEVPPAFSGIAELVKEATQKAIAQSIDSLGNSLDTGALSSQALVAGAADSAKNLVGAITSGSDNKANKKHKKKDKKKKKKS